MFPCIGKVPWSVTGYVTLWARKVTGATLQCPWPGSFWPKTGKAPHTPTPGDQLLALPPHLLIYSGH